VKEDQFLKNLVKGLGGAKPSVYTNRWFNVLLWLLLVFLFFVMNYMLNNSVNQPESVNLMTQSFGFES